MIGLHSLKSRHLLTIQSLIAAVFFIIGLASERFVSESFVARQLIPFLTDKTPFVYVAYFSWLTISSIAFFIFGRWKVARGNVFQERWFDCLVLQALVAFILLTRCLQFPIAYDDSYIDYRYVHNLVWHHTFDYNPGLHVMGFTSHLHLFVLSALSILFHNDDIAFISQQLNIVCQSVSCFLLYGFLRRRINSAAALLGGMLFALDPFLITECGYGKETSIVVMLILIALIALEKKRETVFSWANALLVLARPEGMAWLGAAFVTQYWSQRKDIKAIKSSVRKWIIPMAIVAGWFIFLILYFGTIIPHGALAKTRIYPHRPMIATAVELGAVVSNFIAPLSMEAGGNPLREYAAIKALHTPYSYLFVVLAGLVVIATLVWLALRYRWLRYYAAGVVAISLFFLVSNPSMFTWYYCWFALMPMLMGPCLVNTLARRLHGPAGALMPMALFIYLVSVPIAQAPLEVANFRLPLFVWEDHQQRLLSLLEATQWIKENHGNDKLLAVLEPGIIGYYYEGPVLDLDGLVSDEMLKYYPLKSGTLPSGVVINIPVPSIHDLRPHWMVFFDRIGYNLTRDPEFNQHYTLVKTIPENFGVFKATYVYELTSP